jgi:HEAT repeat protein
VFSTTFLLVAAASLFGCWAVLGCWVLLDRRLHDRVRDRSREDAGAYAVGRLDLASVGRRRLERLALGPNSPTAVAAAGNLVGARWFRLVARASAPGASQSRLHALTILVRAAFPDGLALIRAAIDENDPALTTAVLRIAAERQTDEADALLLEVLVTGAHPRARTATELEPRAGRLRERLIALASHDDPAIRYWAITLLAHEMGNPPVALAVASRAGDDDPNVRAAVAEALGSVDARVARPLLRRLLQDDAFFVRSHAARAVAKAGDGTLAGKLLPLLADQNWWVRAAAKESLLQLGSDGLAVAQRALAHRDRFARDGALEIILGSGHLQELIIAADDGDEAALASVAAIRAQTSEWSIESLPVELSEPAAPRDRDAAVA